MVSCRARKPRADACVNLPGRARGFIDLRSSKGSIRDRRSKARQIVFRSIAPRLKSNRAVWLCLVPNCHNADGYFRKRQTATAAPRSRGNSHISSVAANVPLHHSKHIVCEPVNIETCIQGIEATPHDDDVRGRHDDCVLAAAALHGERP